MLDAACSSASREQIARWCRDGILASRARWRISQIRDGDTGREDRISEEDVMLHPADWARNALGEMEGPHWDGAEAHFDFRTAPIHDRRTNQLWLGGTLYSIQLRRDDLDKLLTTLKPKGKAGRPTGSGGYKESDEPIVEKMRAGLSSGQFKTPHEAAWHFQEKAEGKNTSPRSKVQRLTDRLKRSD